MKIKKSKHEKDIDDAYWRGVHAGIRYTIKNYENALKYEDSVEELRLYVKRVTPVIKNFAELLSKYEVK